MRQVGIQYRNYWDDWCSLTVYKPRVAIAAGFLRIDIIESVHDYLHYRNDGDILLNEWNQLYLSHLAGFSPIHASNYPSLLAL